MPFLNHAVYLGKIETSASGKAQNRKKERINPEGKESLLKRRPRHKILVLPLQRREAGKEGSKIGQKEEFIYGAFPSGQRFHLETNRPASPNVQIRDERGVNRGGFPHRRHGRSLSPAKDFPYCGARTNDSLHKLGGSHKRFKIKP